MRDPSAKISRASPGNPKSDQPGHAAAPPLGATPVSGSPAAPPYAFPPCRSGALTAARTLIFTLPLALALAKAPAPALALALGRPLA